jgi:hypothetical protein
VNVVGVAHVDDTTGGIAVTMASDVAAIGRIVIDGFWLSVPPPVGFWLAVPPPDSATAVAAIATTKVAAAAAPARTAFLCALSQLAATAPPAPPAPAPSSNSNGRWTARTWPR